MINILLTNSGRRDYFIDFLSHIKKYKVKIFCTDTEKNVPTISKKNVYKFFITKKAQQFKYHYKNLIKNLIINNKINLVIPLSDYDLKILAELKNLKIFTKSTFFLVSDKKTIEICISKKKTHHFLIAHKFFSPRIYELSKKIKKFPVILKEDYGNGSKDIKIIKNKNEIPKKINSKFIIQEFIKGREYNIDILNDLNGNFVSCSAKLKLGMRAGETDRCKIVTQKKFFDFSRRLSSALKHIGNLDVDIIVKKEKIYVIDINPRFGGGYPFTHLSGLNYIDYIISLLNNRTNKINPFNNNNIFMNKGISVYAQR